MNIYYSYINIMSVKKSNIFALLNDSDNSDDEQLNTISEKETNNKSEKINKSTVKLNNIKSSSKPNMKYEPSQNSNNKVNSNKFEEEVINQFYGKKIVYNKPNRQNNNFNNTNIEMNNNSNELNLNNNINNMNNNDFIKVVNKKKEAKTMIECKYIDIPNDFENIKTENYFRVLAHHNDDKSWDYNSYFNMVDLKTWGDIGTFFNSVFIAKGECNYTDFDLFVMKNEISPMWEDKENRTGSICSIKIDSLTEGSKIFKNLVIHMANNTLLKFNPSTWNTVNGISFSSKKLDNSAETYCIIIKIWFKINILNYPSIDKLLNDDINQQIDKYSIKNKQIKPEY